MKKRIKYALIALLSMPLSLILGIELILITLPSIERQIAIMVIAAFDGGIFSGVYTWKFIKTFYARTS